MSDAALRHIAEHCRCLEHLAITGALALQQENRDLPPPPLQCPYAMLLPFLPLTKPWHPPCTPCLYASRLPMQVPAV